MSAAKKNKNTLEKSKVSAKGDVNIGDKTTINVYGFEATQNDLKFGIKLIGSLIALFGITTIYILFITDPKTWPIGHIAGFTAGAFTALVLLAFIFLLRLSQNNSIPKNISNEVQNSN